MGSNVVPIETHRIDAKLSVQTGLELNRLLVRGDGDGFLQRFAADVIRRRLQISEEALRDLSEAAWAARRNS